MKNQGIWQYREIRNELNSQRYLSLGEGNTPVDQLDTGVIIKRDDLNPTGSWKDRGTAWKVTELISQGINEVVISSSGNAAISLLKYCNELDLEIKVHVVVSTDVDDGKKKIIEDLIGTKHQIYFDKKARRKSSQISAGTGAKLLRSSTDASILKGYWSLGFELAKNIKKDMDNVIFCPVSSGTGLVGMVQGLYMRIEDESKMPRIIACQTESVCPIIKQILEKSNQFTRRSRKKIGSRKLGQPEDKSLADAIVDKKVLRMPQILNAIDNTSGKAIAITNKELKNAKKQSNLDLSYTSLLSVAGYYKLRDELSDSNVICVASGR